MFGFAGEFKPGEAAEPEGFENSMGWLSSPARAFPTGAKLKAIAEITPNPQMESLKLIFSQKCYPSRENPSKGFESYFLAFGMQFTRSPDREFPHHFRFENAAPRTARIKLSPSRLCRT